MKLERHLLTKKPKVKKKLKKFDQSPEKGAATRSTNQIQNEDVEQTKMKTSRNRMVKKEKKPRCRRQRSNRNRGVRAQINPQTKMGLHSNFMNFFIPKFKDWVQNISLESFRTNPLIKDYDKLNKPKQLLKLKYRIKKAVETDKRNKTKADLRSLLIYQSEHQLPLSRYLVDICKQYTDVFESSFKNDQRKKEKLKILKPLRDFLKEIRQSISAKYPQDPEDIGKYLNLN